jgi:hypothetical protein
MPKGGEIDLKKIIIVSSILLIFSLIFSAALLAGDQDKGKAKTAIAIQKAEAQDVKTNTDKCSHCEHKCHVSKTEEKSNEKCDCENCDLTEGSSECKARHADGECKHVCKHDAEKNNPKDNEKK